MCSVDLKREYYKSRFIDSIRKNKPLRICLLLVLCSAVDGLDAISTPICWTEIIVQNSQRWKFKRRTRVLYAARIWSSEAFLGIPRISWASMIGQKRDAKSKSSHRYSGVISFQVSPFVVEHQKKPT